MRLVGALHLRDAFGYARACHCAGGPRTPEAGLGGFTIEMTPTSDMLFGTTPEDKVAMELPVDIERPLSHLGTPDIVCVQKHNIYPEHNKGGGVNTVHSLYLAFIDRLPLIDA